MERSVGATGSDAVRMAWRVRAGTGGVEEEGKLFLYCGHRVGFKNSPLKTTSGSDFVIWVDSVRRFFW